MESKLLNELVSERKPSKSLLLQGLLVDIDDEEYCRQLSAVRLYISKIAFFWG